MNLRTLFFPENGRHGMQKSAKRRSLRPRYPLRLHVIEHIWMERIVLQSFIQIKYLLIGYRMSGRVANLLRQRTEDFSCETVHPVRY